MTRHRVLFFSIATVLLVVVVLGFVYVVKRDVPPPVIPPAPVEESVVKDPVTHLLGTVKSVSGDSFILEVAYPVFEGAEANLRERTVTIGENTRIIRAERRDAEAMEKDAKAFDRAVAEYEEALAKTGEGEVPPTPPVPPFPATVEVVDRGALEAGESVSVVTAEDVRSLGSFTADSVEIIPAPQE